MYLTYTKGGSNRQYTYISLAETYRDPNGKQRQRIIKKYGRLDKLQAEDPDALEKIQAELKALKDAQYKAESEKLVKDLNEFLASLSNPKSKRIQPEDEKEDQG